MASSALLRAQLRSAPANGHAAFVPHARKVVLEFCQHLPSSANARIFISKDVERVARQNPHVEFVVKQRNGHEPIVRGFYGPSHPLPLPLSLG
jgi:large subunit ribosomal protein L43